MLSFVLLVLYIDRDGTARRRRKVNFWPLFNFCLALDIQDLSLNGEANFSRKLLDLIFASLLKVPSLYLEALSNYAVKNSYCSFELFCHKCILRMAIAEEGSANLKYL